MKKLFAIFLLLFCGALTLPGEAFVVIKGKSSRCLLKPESANGLKCRARRYGGDMELIFRPRRDFQDAKLIFRLRKDDELSFSISGGSMRQLGSKESFDWIDCRLFRVNGQELIGPKTAKGGKGFETFSRSKALKGNVKMKKGEKLILEISLRATPQREARKLSDAPSLSKREKERLKRSEEREKARAAERAKEEEKRKALQEANMRVAEKQFGTKRTDTASAARKNSQPAQKNSSPQTGQAQAGDEE